MIYLFFACSSDVSIMKVNNEETEDTSNVSYTDTNGSIAPPEGVAGYLHYYLKQVSCPACVGEQELEVTMDLQLHDPVNDTYTSWIPEEGSCTSAFYYTTPSTNPISLGSTLNVQSIHPLSLRESSPGTYSTVLYETQYDRNYNYSIHAGDTLLFTFQSLHGFDFIEPYQMLWVDPSYAFEAPISKNGATFWWGPSGDNQQIFNVTVAVYSYDGSQMLGYASCSGADTGQLTIPGQYLSSFPSGSLALIHLTRHKVELELSEYFNSYIETHMEWEVIGTGYVQ